jgi:hypothetical protein
MEVRNLLNSYKNTRMPVFLKKRLCNLGRVQINNYSLITNKHGILQYLKQDNAHKCNFSDIQNV